MVVIDTSVAVKWVIPEDGANIEAGTSAALDLLSQPLIAPDCIMGEFANALWVKILAYAVAVIIAALNLYMLYQIFTGL